MAAPPASAIPARSTSRSRRRSRHNRLVAVSVLSGNRNFEGRVHPNVRANYLASPPLVVAYALLGTMNEDITTAPLGTGKDGKPVYLRDIWPTNKEIADMVGAEPVARAVPAALRRGVQGPRAVAGASRSRSAARPTLVGRLHLRAQPAVFRGHHDGAGAARPTSAARASWPCSATPSPPTTSAPPATSARPRRPANTCCEHQVQPGGLQQLRRAARQPRSDDARHLRQHPHPQRDAARRRGRRTRSTCRPASRCRSTTRRCATRPRACRWW